MYKDYLLTLRKKLRRANYVKGGGTIPVGMKDRSPAWSEAERGDWMNNTNSENYIHKFNQTFCPGHRSRSR